MTDRELLKLAAKAANMEVSFDLLQWEKYWVEGFGFWNPLTDDGDALRLAVKLKIDVYFLAYSVCARSTDVFEGKFEEDGDDHCSVTRRAIVRAAAEIGKETA